MRLVVGISVGGTASPVEEILGLVEIFLLAGHKVEAAEGHLGDLVAWDPVHLARTKADLTDHAVGVLDGDVQEVPFACGLIMSHSSFDHVTEIVELVAEFLDFLPSFCPRPSVGVLWIHSAGGVKIAIGLLASFDDQQDAVDVGL